ncbi:MAG TPA: oligosaccharide flippase family protein [Intrasporangium sp.]|uniref:oligosaccharide flippase family protein n=1 Tax=Intrasporangium sp. TaxID=1925024 RepID=UPI002B4592C5|nr:oligosaccharide flippase family protein [Intrasporangium sp.]HKX68705.1 oligosaccharide flippase family protein [Intrasporangium sp.]
MTPPEEEAPRTTPAGLQHQAIRGAGWTVLHTMLALPTAFVVNLLLARVLGVVDYGRLTFLTLVITTAGSIAALGVGTGVLQFGAKAHAAGRTAEVQQLLGADSAWRLLVSAPLVTLVVLIFVDLDPGIMAVALAFGVWVPSALGGLGIAINIENKTARAAQVAMVGNIVTQVAVIAVLFWRESADAVWAARMVTGSVVVLMLYPAITKAYRRAVLLPRSLRTLPRGFWSFAVPAGLSSTIGMLVVSRSEVLFLQWLSDPVSVGLFGLAFGLALHLFAPAQAFIGPLVPAVSGLAEVDPQMVTRAYTRTLRCSSTVASIMTASALPAFAALVPRLYGPEFAEAAELVLALGIVCSFGIVGGPLTAFAMARLGGTRLLRIDVIALLINVAAAMALIPLAGVWGAVVANASGMIVRVSMLLTGEASHLGVDVRTRWASILPVLLGPLVAGTVWLITLGLSHNDVLRACLLAASGGLGLILLARLTKAGITDADRAAIVRVAPGRIRRAVDFALGLFTSARTLPN